MCSSSRSSGLSRRVLSLVTGVVAALAPLVGLPTGCASTTEATRSPSVKCTPGNYVFCRCQNRDEGTKVCNEDGTSFGTCDPCETDTNLGIPDEPGVPPVEVDAGGPDAQPPSDAVCGDRIVQDGEDCDDGNKVEDDGCDTKCKLAGLNPTSSRSCPGLETHVWSKPVVYVGTTAGAPLVTELTNQNCTSRGANGPDRVFKVTAHKTGKMTVAASGTDYDTLLYVATKCAQFPSQITQLACANDTVGIGNETMSFPVQQGVTYTVVVDGAGISQVQGAFKLTLSIP
jgi:cysteine-rich repeat protein